MCSTIAAACVRTLGASCTALAEHYSQPEGREREAREQEKKKKEKKMCVSHNQNKSHIVWSRRRIRMNNQS